jgi:hypothetical protein
MSDPRPPLDYATPQGGSHCVRRTISAISGLLAGIFAALTLFLGIRGLIWSFTGRWHMAFDLDTFNLFALIMTGLMSAYLSFRLLRLAADSPPNQ